MPLDPEKRAEVVNLASDEPDLTKAFENFWNDAADYGDLAQRSLDTYESTPHGVQAVVDFIASRPEPPEVCLKVLSNTSAYYESGADRKAQYTDEFFASLDGHRFYERVKDEVAQAKKPEDKIKAPEKMRKFLVRMAFGKLRNEPNEDQAQAS